MNQQTGLRSRIFARQTIPELGGEAVVRGGRQLFPRLPEALAGVSQVGVIGWGPQGEAQAQNLRDSLRGSSIRIKVGLRAGSGSFPAARMAGFREADGTLGEMFEVIGESDLVLLLISDAAQAALFQRIFEALGPGVTLGLSHGFLPAHLAGLGVAFPAEVDVIGVCPKGMGPSVRRLYERARCTAGAGINASIAVEQDATGRATDRALAWSIALGAPCSFATTLQSEFRSDVVGERGVLLGALHGLVESLYRHLRSRGMDPEVAFRNSCDSITGPISRGISRGGLRGLYQALEGDRRIAFQRAYCATMMAQIDLLLERGHGRSEIANESVIEAVDSLNPYMHARGVAFMVDSCSTTARLGCRRWAPVFDYAFTQQSFVALEAATPPDPLRIRAFEEHRVHDVLDVCRELRPSIEVAVALQRQWSSSAAT